MKKYRCIKACAAYELGDIEIFGFIPNCKYWQEIEEPEKKYRCIATLAGFYRGKIYTEQEVKDVSGKSVFEFTHSLPNVLEETKEPKSNQDDEKWIEEAIESYDKKWNDTYGKKLEIGIFLKSKLHEALSRHHIGKPDEMIEDICPECNDTGRFNVHGISCKCACGKQPEPSESPFYLVWSDNNLGIPPKKYVDYPPASQEAARLAKENPDVDFYTLKPISKFRGNVEVKTEKI